MKRNIITIEGKSVIVTGNDVWMTAWEIGELFNVTTTAVNAAIRAILKTDVLNDFEVYRYVRLENGLNADVYSLEIIIPIAFRLNTYYTHVFRSWLLRKAYAKEQKDTYMLFVPIAKEAIAENGTNASKNVQPSFGCPFLLLVGGYLKSFR